MKHEPGSVAHESCLFCLLEDFCAEHAAANKEGKTEPLSPDFLISRLTSISPDLVPGIQHDAQEFLLLLLQRLSEVSSTGEKDPLAASATTDISQIFGGWTCRLTECPQCSKTSARYERYLMHSLDIGEASSSVQNALQASSVAENISLTCSHCGKNVRASSRVVLASAPPVLIVHLKRFRAGIQGKISQHIEFSERLNLQNYLIPSQPRLEGSDYTYRLVSVVEHLDVFDIVSFGHYVAYVSGSARGGGGGSNWYLASDTHVSKVPKEQMLKSKAYILVYQRIATNTIGIQCGLPAPQPTSLSSSSSSSSSSSLKSSESGSKGSLGEQDGDCGGGGDASAPALCLGGCGFYGGKDTRGYCSCCFKKKFPEEAQAMAEEKAKRDKEKRLAEPTSKPSATTAATVCAASAQRQAQNAYKKPVIIQEKSKVAYKVGKNEKCPCGSGKKYKLCCYGK